MSGASNDKEGTSGRAASYQSSQGFGQSARQGKSHHGTPTQGKPSVPQKKTGDPSSNGNTSQDGNNHKKNSKE